jgi:hypothetical protein
MYDEFPKCHTRHPVFFYIAPARQTSRRAFGVNNGVRTASGLAANRLPAAPLLSQTSPTTLPADTLRVNGAAVRPRCQ